MYHFTEQVDLSKQTLALKVYGGHFMRYRNQVSGWWSHCLIVIVVNTNELLHLEGLDANVTEVAFAFNG